MREHLFEARRVTKRYGRFTALDDVDLKLDAGQFITVFGANGAGKTTFLKIAATLMQPTEGKVLYHGSDVRESGGGARKNIGYIAHSTFLYKNLTARENLRFYGTMYGVDDLDRCIDERLDAVGLFRWADKPVLQFSRGMQQRLTIGRAFLHDPSILLLDEPYTGLDSRASGLLNRLLQNAGTERCAGLLTTHNIEQGFDIATHVAVLHRGKLHYFESTAAVSRGEFKNIYLDVLSA